MPIEYKIFCLSLLFFSVSMVGGGLTHIEDGLAHFLWKVLLTISGLVALISIIVIVCKA